MEDKIFKSEFVELINNDEFVSYVAEAYDPGKLLANMVLEHPENASDLRYAVEFILLTRSDKKQIPEEDSEIILRNLKARLNKGNTQKTFFRRVAVFKIAAAVLAIVAIGSLVFYYQTSRDPLKQFAEENSGQGSESVIILSDGSRHTLEESELNIDYQTNQGEVLVQNKENEVTKLENKAKAKEEELNQVIVPFGQRQNLVLADGTSVELNAGSKLVFPAAFLGGNRTVYLVGEGFFKVHKDSEHPFIVKTDYIDVKVLGTVFNVAAYKDEDVVSAVLVEGSVAVSESGKILRSQSKYLTPGEGCFYSSEDKVMDIKNVDIDFYTSWKDGIYNFKDVPLSHVLKRVMRYYDISINVDDNDILETKLSGKLRITGDIEEVMQYISKTLECRYQNEQKGEYTLYK